jgi:hypothetical protein
LSHSLSPNKCPYEYTDGPLVGSVKLWAQVWNMSGNWGNVTFICKMGRTVLTQDSSQKCA